MYNAFGVVNEDAIAKLKYPFYLGWKFSLTALCDLLLLLILEKSAQIKEETSYIEFEAYFPPQLNLENVKISLNEEGPHHNNNFF